MTRANLLDRTIGETLPRLGSEAELRAFESTPYTERIAAQSTYEALQIGAAHDPSAPAMHFLRKADPAETPLTVTFAQFIGRVTQSANLFTDLGIGHGDVVSFLLPLLPQSFFTLFGAQAAGIANPVNPLLSAPQITEILRAAKTKVLVALGPVPGSDIWAKVQHARAALPDLRAIVVVHGASDAAQRIHSYDELIDRYPADRLRSGRRIAASDIAGYFHTGGTTGTPKLVRHTHANQVYQAWALGLMLPLGPRRTLLFGLPLFHVGRRAGASPRRSEMSGVWSSATGRRCSAPCPRCWLRRWACPRATPTSLASDACPGAARPFRCRWARHMSSVSMCRCSKSME
jgi:fatty-acyl-CoA synthase